MTFLFRAAGFSLSDAVAPQWASSALRRLSPPHCAAFVLLAVFGFARLTMGSAAQDPSEKRSGDHAAREADVKRDGSSEDGRQEKERSEKNRTEKAHEDKSEKTAVTQPSQPANAALSEADRAAALALMDAVERAARWQEGYAWLPPDHPAQSNRAAPGNEASERKCRLALPALVALLSDEDAAIRRRAARALGFAYPYSDSAWLPLRNVLQNDESAEVRAAAALAMGRFIGAAQAAGLGLIPAMHDPSPQVRERAALSLGRLGMSDESTRIALVIRSADAEGAVRAASIEALLRIVPEEGWRFAMQFLESEDEYVRMGALEGMKWLLPPDEGERQRLAAALLGLVSDQAGEHRVRALALQRLMDYGAGAPDAVAAFRAALAAPVTGAWPKGRFDDKEGAWWDQRAEDLRPWQWDGVTDLPERVMTQAIPAWNLPPDEVGRLLAPLLKPDDPHLKFALAALMRYGRTADESIPILREIFQKTEDPNLIEGSLAALLNSSMPREELAALAAPRAKTGDFFSIEALCKCGEAIRPYARELLEVFHQTDLMYVQRTITQGLVELGDLPPEWIPELEDIVVSFDPRWQTKSYQAAEMLACAGSQGQARLVELLEESAASEVRIRAAYGLSRVGADAAAAVPSLFELYIENHAARAQIAEMFTRLGAAAHPFLLTELGATEGAQSALAARLLTSAALQAPLDPAPIREAWLKSMAATDEATRDQADTIGRLLVNTGPEGVGAVLDLIAAKRVAVDAAAPLLAQARTEAIAPHAAKLQALSDANPKDVPLALAALHASRSDQTQQAWAIKCLTHSNALVSRVAAEACRDLNCSGAAYVEALIGAVKLHGLPDHILAIRALGREGGAAAAPALLERLEDVVKNKTPIQDSALIETVAELAPERSAVKPFQSLLKRNDPSVSQRVGVALPLMPPEAVEKLAPTVYDFLEEELKKPHPSPWLIRFIGTALKRADPNEVRVADFVDRLAADSRPEVNRYGDELVRTWTTAAMADALKSWQIRGTMPEEDMKPEDLIRVIGARKDVRARAILEAMARRARTLELREAAARALAALE